MLHAQKAWSKGGAVKSKEGKMKTTHEKLLSTLKTSACAFALVHERLTKQ